LTSLGFQTDTDISGGVATAQRELQPWVPDGSDALPNGPPRANGAAARDSETFGATPTGGKAWDQFETNARLFGTKTSYQEEIYTTKLNKGGPDFKKREKEAEKLANEIMGVSQMAGWTDR
jgi:PAB1-binding protein PBP1